MDSERNGLATSTGDRPRSLAETYRKLGASQNVTVTVEFEDGSELIHSAFLRFSKNHKRPDDRKGRDYKAEDAFYEVEIRWIEQVGEKARVRNWKNG